MPTYPSCPQCGLDDTYPDGAQLVCPHCAHEWVAGEEAGSAAGEPVVVRDCNGNPLAQGDSVVVIKDLKVRGSSIPLKQGTLIRNIRLVPDDAEHIEGQLRQDQGAGAQDLLSAQGLIGARENPQVLARQNSRGRIASKRK